MRDSTPRCDCRTPGLTPTQGPTPPCRRDPDWDLGPAQNLGTCSTACRQPWWRRSAPRRPHPRRMPPLCTAWLPPPLGLDSTPSALVSTLSAVVSTLSALVSTLSPGQYILSHDRYTLNPGRYIALVSTLALVCTCLALVSTHSALGSMHSALVSTLLAPVST